jgi:hypothetical protein
MIRLVRLTAFTIAAIGIMLIAGQIAARAAGVLNVTPAAAILDVESCPQPCWNGIQPGKTSLIDAKVSLARRPNVTFPPPPTRSTPFLEFSVQPEPLWLGRAYRWSSTPLTGPLNYVELKPPPGVLLLGEAIQLFGEPVAATLCLDFDRINPTLQPPFMDAHLHFRNNIEVKAYHPLALRAQRYDPQMVVWLVRYNYPGLEPPYRFDTPRWGGFGAQRSDQAC